jgi:hypothetical protein
MYKMKEVETHLARILNQKIDKLKQLSYHLVWQKNVFLALPQLLFILVVCFDSYGQTMPGILNVIPQPPHPWSPFQKGYPIQSNYPSKDQAPSAIFQYEKDLQERLERQRKLEELYNVISNPEFDNSNIHYDLPICTTFKGTNAYLGAYEQLLKMAIEQKPYDLAEANFIVENAYFENIRDFDQFRQVTKQIGQFLIFKMTELNYDKTSNLAKNLILLRFFTDTLEIKSKKLIHYPILYDFEDYRGKKDWSKMFVEKILSTNSGQCHSMPLLYLILAEEIGAKAWLAYSPNHTYIKFQDDNNKWYNIELTNGMLTTDAFVFQSGYIKAEALQNKIYMHPLTEKQLLSHHLFDLAKGYTRKYCYDHFVEKVIYKALELDSSNINAHLMLADYYTLRFRYIENQIGPLTNENFRQVISQYPKAKEVYRSRNQQYDKIENIGHADMPSEAYEKWLNSLGETKKKQASQQLLNNLNKKIELRNKEVER